jgi:hypothetical protein
MLKKILQNFLWNLNYDLSKVYFSKDDLETLINILKPIKSSSDLIRIGNQHGDGGYLMPSDFADVKYLFSLGVGSDFSFETELSKKKIKCFLADHSVELITSSNINIKFTKKFIKTFNSDRSLRFETWKQECIENTDDSLIIIKIDIEGDEYDVIKTLSDITMKQTKFLIVEFHALTKIFSINYRNKILDSFKRLSEFFYCTHIHVNNVSGVMKIDKYEIPHCMEVTFVNKKFIPEKLEYINKFNHPLDKPNVINKPEIQLPEIFYK